MIGLIIGMAMTFLGLGLLLNTPILESYLTGSMAGNYWVKKIGYHKAKALHRWFFGPVGFLLGVVHILMFFKVM